MSANERYHHTLAICLRHAKRLRWALAQLSPQLPFDEHKIDRLSDVEFAVVDQLLARFGQLQDTMGKSLFPAILELTKEQGELVAFIDQLHRLEKLGAVTSADAWLELRALRNALTHEYPDEPSLQAAMLNKTVEAAVTLLAVLDCGEKYAKKYL
ncbi:MAG: hypothetical protein R8J85_04870 [Mariprofundales bacterium]